MAQNDLTSAEILSRIEQEEAVAYGINDSALEQMKKDQDYKCYLCYGEGFLIGKNNHNEKLAVDHDHNTGKVRKLLCHNCNRALGLFKDNPELMRKAALYVEEHRE